jgi:hypothetical protein
MGCSLLAEQSRGLTPQLSARSIEYRCDSALKLLKERHPCIALFPRWEEANCECRFSRIFWLWAACTGLLLWFGNENEPIEPALTTSQTVGVPKFKPEPEAEHARATAVNFAAEYKRSERKSLKAAEMPPRQKTTTNYSKPQPLGHLAEFPHDNLSIR